MTAEELKEIIETALQEIRPFLEADGGNISIVDISLETTFILFELF